MSNENWKAVDVVQATEQAQQDFEGDDPYQLVMLVLEQNENTGEYRLNHVEETEIPAVRNGATPKNLMKDND